MLYRTKEAGLPFKAEPPPPSNSGGATVSEETVSLPREDNLVHEESKAGKAGEGQQ